MSRFLTNMTDLMARIVSDQERTLSFLHPSQTDLESWKQAARAKTRELLCWDPPPCAHNAQTLSVENRGTHRVEDLRLCLTPYTETAAYVVAPKGKGPFPALVGLHCHSGHFYYGREKLVGRPDDDKVIRALIKKNYGDRHVAEELAKEGFLVLVIDSIFFGSRRLRGVEAPMRPWIRETWNAYESESDALERIRKYQRAAGRTQGEMTKHCLMAGVSWPGLIAIDDMRSIDYLLTRPDVDPDRIGCFGLSYGGYRSALLAGLDPRVKSAVVTGWMTDMGIQTAIHGHAHSGMNTIPGMLQYLDLPDLVSCIAPGSLLVQNCKRDDLYPMEGMESAGRKIERTFAKAGCPEQCKVIFYDTTHQFNREMQKDAFEWLGRSLNP